MPSRRPKRRRPWLNDGSCVRLRPEHRDQVWSYDLMEDRTGLNPDTPVRTLIRQTREHAPQSGLAERRLLGRVVGSVAAGLLVYLSCRVREPSAIMPAYGAG